MRIISIFSIRAVLLLILFIIGGSMESVLILDDSTKSCSLWRQIEWYKDISNKFTITDFLKDSSKIKFSPCTKPIQSYGFISSPLWTRFNISNSASDTLNFYFEIQDAYFNIIELYKKSKTGICRYVTGIDSPFKQREIYDRNFVFPLLIPPKDTLSVYVKLKSRSSIELPFNLYNEESFQSRNIRESLLFGMFYGIIIIIICINLVLFLVLKDINYFLYTLVILTFGLFQGTLDGYTYMYFWSDFPNIQKYSFHILALLSIFCGLIFSAKFLFPSFSDLPLKKIFHSKLICVGCLIIHSFFGSTVVTGHILDLLVISSVLYVFYIAIISCRKKYHPARYYLIAWTIFLICIGVRVIACSGIIPYIQSTFYAIHIGILCQIFLTMVAMGDRLRIIQKENETNRVKSSEYKRKELEMQLSNLQAQVKPHFLFNTINSIANLVVTQPKQAENALVELSNLYRQKLDHSSRIIVSLKEEVEFLHLYLKLEKIKLGNRLDFNIEIPSIHHELKIPFMTLQLLVENSIKHGIHHKPSGGFVSVKAKSIECNKCKLVVEDNGVGLKKNDSGNGYGLKCLKEGLNLIYGDKFSFLMEDKKTFNSDSESGVRISIVLPFCN